MADGPFQGLPIDLMIKNVSGDVLILDKSPEISYNNTVCFDGR
jgi:hypothetical protein